MRATQKNSCQQTGDYIEVSVPAKADYGAVCREAADVFKLEAPHEDCILRLFRIDGTIVLNQVIKTPSGLKAWNIERFLGLLQWSASTGQNLELDILRKMKYRCVACMTIDTIIVYHHAYAYAYAPMYIIQLSWQKIKLVNVYLKLKFYPCILM